MPRRRTAAWTRAGSCAPADAGSYECHRSAVRRFQLDDSYVLATGHSDKLHWEPRGAGASDVPALSPSAAPWHTQLPMAPRSTGRAIASSDFAEVAAC